MKFETNNRGFVHDGKEHNVKQAYSFSVNNLCTHYCGCKQKLLIGLSINTGLCSGCRLGNCKGDKLL